MNEMQRLKSELKEKDSQLRVLKRELERSKNREGDLEKTRKAMLYMLEDLNDSHEKAVTSQRQWAQTFDAISVPLFIHDQDFRIVRANRAYQMAANISFKQLIGKKYWEVFPKMDGPLKGCKISVGSKEEKKEDEDITDPLSGRIFRMRYYPVSQTVGERFYSLHIFEDITEEKRTQEILVQTSKLASIGELASNVAHEINNPMTAVLGYTALILEELEEDSPHYNELKAVERESYRVRDIIRGLLDFTRQRKTRKSLSDINKVIDECMTLLKHIAEVSNINIKLNLSKKIPKTMVDENQMRQVFINLMNNAVHAMPNGGELCITTELAGAKEKGLPNFSLGNNYVGDYIVTTFQDVGCGISEEDKERIFEPFYTSKGEEGTGLGLSVTYGIVKNHGGDILVKSKLGEGAEFNVVLPVVKYSQIKDGSDATTVAA